MESSVSCRLVYPLPRSPYAVLTETRLATARTLPSRPQSACLHTCSRPPARRPVSSPPQAPARPPHSARPTNGSDSRYSARLFAPHRSSTPRAESPSPFGTANRPSRSPRLWPPIAPAATIGSALPCGLSCWWMLARADARDKGQPTVRAVDRPGGGADWAGSRRAGRAKSANISCRAGRGTPSQVLACDSVLNRGRRKPRERRIARMPRAGYGQQSTESNPERQR